MPNLQEIIPDSELILNSDGSVFHLHLRPENIADTILLVGDQGRVQEVSKLFDKIEFQASNREFVTHTGTYRGKRITCISTGIGTDNVDIVINELDALVNIDLKERTALTSNNKKLTLIRLGTSGALQEDIPVDSFVLSTHGLGFDGLLNYYQADKVYENNISEAFIKHTNWAERLPYPYIVAGSPNLLNILGEKCHKGITATAPGFYGPQGRKLRLQPAVENLNELLTQFNFQGNRITNFEMETSALYGLGKMLGHDCATVCTIIANRIRKEYSADYKKAVKNMIGYVLDKVTA
jgi:uridine phosphorylase